MDNIRTLGIRHENSKVSNRVTISAGVAAVRPEKGVTSAYMVEIADKALYQAKQNGRNKAQLSS
jgi:diguanylate cyclase (GGDEF)-like protein